MERIRTIARGMADAYVRLFRTTGVLAAGAAAVILVSIIVVTPLWFVATRFSTVFTVVSLGAIVLTTAGFLVHRLATRSEARVAFFGLAKKTLLFAGGLILIYIIVLLFSLGMFVAAVPLTLVFVVAFGLLLYDKKSTRR
jgi:hypothetical protein